MEVVAEWQLTPSHTLDAVCSKSEQSWEVWRRRPLTYRVACVRQLASVLLHNQDAFARLISTEMGKPITEARAEIQKCALLCSFYADEADEFIKPTVVEELDYKGYVRRDPLGVLLAVMPWNFPFWQVFRCAIPAICAGNVVMLKPAPNVIGCAYAILSAFNEAGFDSDVFSVVVVDVDDVEKLIAHNAVRGVAFTGSTVAGSAIARLAGSYRKKSVLELGGNNAFVVLSDSDVSVAANDACVSRFLNAGQSCIATKRVILSRSIAEEFMGVFCERVGSLVVGNPLHDETILGPMARLDLAHILHSQQKESVRMGAKVVIGGIHSGTHYQPTVVTNVLPGMPAFDEETFGPLCAVTVALNDDEAVNLAQRTKYGLGVSIYTKDQERAERIAEEMNDGAVFINAYVKSDPRYPFGGTRDSGYGRELGAEGLLEFVNHKTVIIKEQPA